MIGLPAKIIRDIIPDYLKSVPLPYSFADVKNLSGKDFLHLVVFTGAVAGTVHYGILPLIEAKNNQRCNNSIELDNAKVVNSVKISKISEEGTKWYCRCWKSKNWPYCDGSHTEHNKKTGDNVGPLGVKNE